MSIVGRDFLNAAQNCLKEGGEADLRSAVSRSYYGLYHEVCAILTCCPPTTHDGVVQYLTVGVSRKAEPFELMSMTKVGAVLRQQKTKRKVSDYELKPQPLSRL